jgi:hypothetical protein
MGFLLLLFGLMLIPLVPEKPYNECEHDPPNGGIEYTLPTERPTYGGYNTEPLRKELSHGQE